MPRLRLLGGAVETLPGIVIEGEDATLQGLAMEAQAKWFTDPSNTALKADYGMKLRHWAAFTHNARALAHAATLEAP